MRGATKYRTALRIIIDPTLRTPLDSNILNDDAPTLLVHAENVDTSAFSSHDLFALPIKDDVLQLAPLFRYLVTKYDATNVIVEGGATLFGHIFSQNLANELWVFTAPIESKMSPKSNMIALADTLTTALIDEQACGTDIVRRYSVNH